VSVADFLPRRDAAFGEWANQFREVVERAPMAVGIPQADVPQLVDRQRAFAQALQRMTRRWPRNCPCESARRTSWLWC